MRLYAGLKKYVGGLWAVHLFFVKNSPQPTKMAESIGAQMVGRKLFPLGTVMTKLAGIVRT